MGEQELKPGNEEFYRVVQEKHAIENLLWHTKKLALACRRALNYAENVLAGEGVYFDDNHDLPFIQSTLDDYESSKPIYLLTKVLESKPVGREPLIFPVNPQGVPVQASIQGPKAGCGVSTLKAEQLIQKPQTGPVPPQARAGGRINMTYALIHDPAPGEGAP